ncbi:differentially expressed in FDCP 8 homolog A-like isoform X2 [Macrobrachium nipponense]|uniref:differentially expressed in FDCP 8 homolog A-like isoform X2 n=1 Tax=Macrobrachium nipponense TaxID=159736 RepID=UPI0030C8526D
MSEDTVWSASEAANVYLSSVVAGASDVASSVTQSVGVAVHTVAYGMGDVVQNVSSGVGGAVHEVTSGVKRLLTSPPKALDDMDEDMDEDEHPGVLPPTPRNSTSPYLDLDHPQSDQSPGTDSEMAAEEAAINIELGITEDHFCRPEEGYFEQSLEELEGSVEKCKTLILQCEESSTRRRALVHKLIQLRLRVQEANESIEIASSGVVCLMNHHFQPLKPPLARASKEFCDQCANIIWGVIHVSYRCTLCGYRCHGRCVNRVRRRCASVKVNEEASYILSICPEVGLSAQNYRCAECRRLITNKYFRVFKKNGKEVQRKENAWSEPRRCDYSGLYYCPACHWNSRVVLPARVVHNWDFEERVVSRQAKQFLLLMKNKPVLNVERINGYLFKFVDELGTVKKLREDLLVMKQYLGTCRSAQESRMLRQLEERQHFVENAHMYSLQDLIDTNSGQLVDYLKKVHETFSNHIKNECLVCQGKGYICEICDVSEIIFPFDGGVVICNGCSTVLHHFCYTSRSTTCPRCLRQEARRKQELTKQMSKEEEG